jgi:hypothetical protein
MLAEMAYVNDNDSNITASTDSFVHVSSQTDSNLTHEDNTATTTNDSPCTSKFFRYS